MQCLKNTLLIIGLGLILLPTDSQAQATIGQTAFTVPKPKIAVLRAMQNGTIQNMLLATGLDKQLEKEFPSNNPNAPTEVVVQLFVKALGVPARVAPITVIRDKGKTWKESMTVTEARVRPNRPGPGAPGDSGRSGPPPYAYEPQPPKIRCGTTSVDGGATRRTCRRV